MRDIQDPYKPMDKIIKIIRFKGRDDLVRLLRGSYYTIEESTTYGSYLFSVLSTAEVFASLPNYERLKVLSKADENLILNAFLALYPPKANSIEITSVEFYLDPDEDIPLELNHPKELDKIDFEYIHEQINKCDEKIGSKDYDGAITNARTLLENICYYILENSDLEYKPDGDLPKLYKETLKVLDLGQNSQSEEIFKQILSGCTTIVFGLSRVRNVLGDAHGRPSKNYLKPTKHQATLVVEISKAVSEFLYSTYSEKKIKKSSKPT
jgi:hypothetical protein